MQGGINMFKKFLTVMAAGALCLCLSVTALGAGPSTELEKAAAYVRDHGIMSGDQNGSLNLESGLNRAELAVLLTRLNDGTEEVRVNTAFYERNCKFADVSAWARLYVGYCTKRNLMAGYGSGIFGSNDMVTPAMACTVVLRACGVEDGGGSVWNYSTACAHAVSLGWIDDSVTRADTITRGNMAILIYRALTGAKPEDGTVQETGDGYLTNGKPVTEENVLEILHQLEVEWPTWTPWDDPKLNPDTCWNEVPSTETAKLMRKYHTNGTYGCGGYASMISSRIFGDQTNPCRKVEDLTQIRPGDVIFWVNNSTGKIWHVSVALESPNNIHAYHITDGNHGGIVYWPDQESEYSRENLDSFGEDRSHHLEAWTRYPESVPYTGNSVMAWSTSTEQGGT